MVLHLVQVLMYYLQSKEDMFEIMRPYVIITNLLALGWFIAIQFYRFKDTGRACSGDFLTKIPDNYNEVYLNTEGQWFLYYIIAHYIMYVIQKVISIAITNKFETEFEKKKSLIVNKL